MTRKDYVAIATVIKNATVSSVTVYEYDGIAYVTNKLADYFVADNPRFDKAMFLKACGVDASAFPKSYCL